MNPIVFVDGNQGTTGLQILSRLQPRADIELVVAPPERRKDARWRADMLNACDVAILCLPDAAAREAVSFISNPRVRVIDASSAHRTEAGWVYGFPELEPGQADRIAAAGRVTNPGCYPTGALALLRPLVSAGLLQRNHPIDIHAISGYSGAGKAGIEAHEGENAATAAPLQVYGLGLEHKHVPEIQQHAGLSERPFFVPAYGAYRQGIVLTIALHQRLLPEGVDGHRVQACLAAHYAGAKQVQVIKPEDAHAMTHIDPTALNGTNDLRLAVFHNERRGQILLTAVFDNLGKGASGAAVQNLALMLGLEV